LIKDRLRDGRRKRGKEIGTSDSWIPIKICVVLKEKSNGLRIEFLLSTLFLLVLLASGDSRFPIKICLAIKEKSNGLRIEILLSTLFLLVLLAFGDSCFLIKICVTLKEKNKWASD